MDHKQAVELHLAVKYVLGELPSVQRDEYEDHYIDCPECAKDVHAAAAFTDAAREVFREEARGKAPDKERVQSRWFAWFRPAFAVPAFAALLLVVIYQDVVTIPRAKQMSGRGGEGLISQGAHPSDQSMKQASLSQEAPAKSVSGMNPLLVAAAVPLHALNLRRGGDASTGEGDSVQARPGDAIALRLDFTPTQAFDSYVGKVLDSSGRELFQITVPGSSYRKTVQLVIPAGLLKPGNYFLTFAGDPGAKGFGTGSEVLSYRFSVAFQQ